MMVTTFISAIICTQKPFDFGNISPTVFSRALAHKLYYRIIFALSA